jgi:DNA polymerase V
MTDKKIKGRIEGEETRVNEIITPEREKEYNLSLFLESVSAGFPSPADDYIDSKLDLNDYLIKNPPATFFVRVTGDSMINAGIHSGDILVVDRSIEPKDNHIIIAVIDGELLVKRMRKKKNKLFLHAENPYFKPIEINSQMNFEVWGVVTNVIHSLI